MRPRNPPRNYLIASSEGRNKMAIRRTTIHPVVGKVEWETDKLESGHSIKLLNNFEKNIGLVTVLQLVGIKDVRTEALEKAGAKFNGLAISRPRSRMKN